MEEDEALEMGREAATIRQIFYFSFRSFFSSCDSPFGQGSLCQDS